MDCPIIEHIRDVDRGHVGSAVYCFGGRVDELKGPLTARTGALYISVILTDATVNVDYERMQATIFGRDDKSLPRVQPGDYLFLTNVKFQLRDHGSIHCVSTAKTTYYGWDPSIPKKVTKNEKVLVTPQQLSILSKYFMKHCRELLAREHDRGVVTVRQQHSNAPGNTPSKQSNVPSNAPPKPSTEAPTSAQPRQEPAVVPTNVIVSTSNTYNGTFSKPRILLRDLTASMTTSVVVQVIRALTSGRTYVLQVSDFTSNEAFKACDAVEGMGLPCGKYSMEVAVYDGSKKYCLDNIECGAIITIDQLQLRMSPYGNLEARVNGDRMNPARSFIRVLAEDDPEALIVIARRAKCLERLRRNEYENGLTLPPEPKFGKDAQNGVHADSKAVEASPHQESTLSRSVGQYEPRQSLSPSRYSDPPTRTFDPADYRKASKLPSSQSDMNPPVKGEKRKNEEADENASKRLDAVSQPSTNTEINKPSRTSLNGKENATQAVKSPPAQPATKLSQNSKYFFTDSEFSRLLMCYGKYIAVTERC
ncbi:hypothetical protein POJ06DRAFT_254203 [Lipomyces tetrasporus]|uniref:Protection of telomeres protein 1 ssDNA-binding domain-containing protein n=1 Tax=Lipomyces tetrasporus TaxID=54092 RepID=A0AAD7QR09_9ASCO|nr:uncharacterized protein POJ06DRAFT_254203 [Lipomyces tetrasporus]KAJ8099676.1 hypothetical protein POJ06DRAFT_254203 [Lipomyces tetrasporus]